MGRCSKGVTAVPSSSWTPVKCNSVAVVFKPNAIHKSLDPGDASIVNNTVYLAQFVVNVILEGVGAETAVAVPVATPERKYVLKFKVSLPATDFA